MMIPWFIKRWLYTTGYVALGAATAWLLVSHFANVRLLSVQTASMKPTFSPGDALLMKQSDHIHLRLGMVVSYRSSRNPNELITHRVVAAHANSFKTKGDALISPDPAVRASLVEGRVVAVLPNLGKVLGWFASWPGLTTTVYLPASVLLCQEVRRLQRHYRSVAKYTLIRTTSGMMNTL